jgi:hypothetical protein
MNVNRFGDEGGGGLIVLSGKPTLRDSEGHYFEGED